ncbi:unnamed protein product [Brachionus calyciflorus]|uniref:Transmembrane protein 107 n=1 Tax=Brachionus calyciflorus TaxID=104777 RepID=A0A813PGM9_9BILA|nr:unnamed protein product [Brachionus calyciflorus]
MIRIYTSYVPILFSLRFITIISHLVLLIILLLDRNPNTNKFIENSSGLYNSSDLTQFDTEYIVWLSVSLGILVIELTSFLFTVSSLVIYQSLISILTHSIGVFVIFGFYTDAWIFSDIRWVFGFCTAIPFLTEILAYVEIFIRKKTYF